jgi:hypothetical protein
VEPFLDFLFLPTNSSHTRMVFFQKTHVPSPTDEQEPLQHHHEAIELEPTTSSGNLQRRISFSSDASSTFCDEPTLQTKQRQREKRRRRYLYKKQQQQQQDTRGGYQRLGGHITDAWHSVTSRSAMDHQDGPLTEDEAALTQHHPEHDMNSGIKRGLYLLLEEPSSSRAAFWTNVVVSFLIVSSAVMTTIETIPAFRSAESNRVW